MFTSRHHRQLYASAHHQMKRHLLASAKQNTRHG
jgi:hypothetical protein